jgi:hypothetical protein
MVAGMVGKKSKEPAAKADGAAEGGDTPKKRSKLKLALFAAVPLVLAGGGYGAWAMFFVGPAEAEVHAAEDGHEKPDPEVEATAWRAIASESSFTHSFALSVLIQQKCGKVRAPALREASDAEAKLDGLLAQLSWVAASRRAELMTEKSCGYLVAEIEDANAKAYQKAAEAAEKKKGGKGGH